MRQIREACPRPARDSTVPNEILYADDTDFITTEMTYDTVILKSWNLAIKLGILLGDYEEMRRCKCVISQSLAILESKK